MPDADRGRVELFGTPSCRFTAEMREDLLWRGVAFDEYNVDAEPEALQRMLDLTGGQRLVPVLVKDGEVSQIGVGGRGCYVDPKTV